MMAVTVLDWHRVVAHALTLPDTELSTHYGRPSVKVRGHAFLTEGREASSFVLHISLATKQILMETDPATYWQTPHYDGWPAVLVRYNSSDPDRVFAMIGAAWEGAAARKKKPRK